MHTLTWAEKIKYLVGDADRLFSMEKTASKKIFDDLILSFLGDLSTKLLNASDIKQYPDIASYAFWIRKKNIQRIKKQYENDSNLRIGQGIIFHLAPSNIPVQFAVTLTMGLLAGNVNIVRVSDKEFEEVTIICDRINELLCTDYKELIPYIFIIRYGHDDDITGYFSKICNVRMIWGGDRTINSIRKIPTGSRSFDLCFADRTSVGIIDSEAILKTDNIFAVAKDFYADTYYVDQNACSSPMILIWTGKNVEKAKQVFWNAVEKTIDEYTLSPIAGSEKLLRFCLYSMNHHNVTKISHNNKLVRVEINEIDEDVLANKCNMGYFYEYSTDDLSDIVPLLDSKCQTVSVYEINKEDVAKLVIDNGVKGVDRVVQMGQALGISVVWDGYDLVRNLSRVVTLL